MSIDPKAEKFSSWSPYNYCYDNPITFIDPDGEDTQEADKNKTYQNQSTTYTYTYNGDNSHSVSQTTTTTSYSYDKDNNTWDQTTTTSTSTETFSSADGKFTETGGNTTTTVSETKGNLSLYKDDKGNVSTEFNSTGKTKITSDGGGNFDSSMMPFVDKGHFQDCVKGVQNWLSDNGMKSTPLVEAYSKIMHNGEIDGMSVGIGLAAVKFAVSPSNAVGSALSLGVHALRSNYVSNPEHHKGESIILIPVKKKE